MLIRTDPKGRAIADLRRMDGLHGPLHPVCGGILPHAKVGRNVQEAQGDRSRYSTLDILLDDRSKIAENPYSTSMGEVGIQQTPKISLKRDFATANQESSGWKNNS